MRRVVVTGIGIISCIGSSADEVSASLRAGKSGIVAAPEYAELGFRSAVHGMPTASPDAVDRRIRRFMGDGAAWNYLAMQQAIADSGLSEAEVSHENTGLVMGSGGPSTRTIVKAFDAARAGGARKVGPFAVPASMSSTNSATLAVPFKIKGVNYSISSACATGVHCIGHAADLIRFGRQEIMFAGGGEELDPTLSVLFDGMGALASAHNDTPAVASRPYAADRDGFVIAGGAGVLVLESLERAQARGAKIYGEIAGYAANSDGFDMVQPSGEGAVRCMRAALAGCERPDYINPHATATGVGDKKEAEAMRTVFGSNLPPLSGTKAMTGHSLGAAGAQEAIYCLLMMRDGFIAPSINIDQVDPEFADLPIVRETRAARLDTVLSNSFGFGGTNGCLVLQRVG